MAETETAKGKGTGFGVILVELPQYVQLNKLHSMITELVDKHGGSETIRLVVNEDEPCKQRGCADCGL